MHEKPQSKDVYTLRNEISVRDKNAIFKSDDIEGMAKVIAEKYGTTPESARGYIAYVKGLPTSQAESGNLERRHFKVDEGSGEEFEVTDPGAGPPAHKPRKR